MLIFICCRSYRWSISCNQAVSVLLGAYLLLRASNDFKLNHHSVAHVNSVCPAVFWTNSEPIPQNWTHLVLPPSVYEYHWTETIRYLWLHIDMQRTSNIFIEFSLQSIICLGQWPALWEGVHPCLPLENLAAWARDFQCRWFPRKQFAWSVNLQQISCDDRDSLRCAALVGVDENSLHTKPGIHVRHVVAFHVFPVVAVISLWRSSCT